MRFPRMPNWRNTPRFDDNDLGFGTRVATHGERLLNKDGSYNIVRTGSRIWTPYQNLVEMSWPRFFMVVLLFYVSVNALFAGLFLLIGVEGFAGVPPGVWWQEFIYLFFFSMQTFTTVGYGAISPSSVPANAAAAFDALVGLMTLALATGLFFARFSRPKANIRFSRNALISPYGEGKSFMFRIVNIRHNKIINLEAQVIMTWIEERDNGLHRRFAALPLERDKVTMFPLNWTIVHPITPDSPLFEKSDEDLRRMQAEFVILIEGFDDTFSQTVHANSSYNASEVACNARFLPMYRSGENGNTVLELDKIDDYEMSR